MTDNDRRVSDRAPASTRRRRRIRRRRVGLQRLEIRRCLAAGPPLDLSSLEIDPGSYEESAFIVRYRAEVASPATSDAVYGPTAAVDSSPIGFGLHRVETLSGVSVDSVITEYRDRPEVLYAEPDYHVRVATLPDDARFGDQWDMHNVGQNGGTVDADIDAPEAWETSVGNGSTVVAVIDTGVDYRHPDLAPNIWTNPGEIAGDGIDNDNNGFVDDIHGYDFFNDDGDPLDDNNHGTHVAGTIGARGNDGTGVAGVNWNAQIMAVKFLGADGSGTTSDAIAAVQYAVDNGAQISNNSWGGDPYSQALYDVIADARDVGHIFVAAAGNGNFIGIGQDNDGTPFFPSSYDLDNVVSVAATDRNDARAVFSNYGSTSVDLGAPGVDILSTTAGGGYGNSSGTSMAAPHVAGVLSLVRDENPGLTYRQLIDRVLLSADPVESMQGVTVTGGRLNASSSLVPDTFGPEVAAVQPSGLVLDPFDSLRISFDESVEIDSFTLDDIASLAGPDGEVPLSSLAPVPGTNGRQFDLTFPVQATAGDYELVVLPGVVDRFGNVMDQNDNGIGGESPEDEFRHTFVKADAVGRFDFGTTLSDVAVNYTRIVGGDRYSAETGYGWADGSVYSLSRGGDPLTRDLNYTADATFAMDLPNGEYDVTAIMGEALIAHDSMGVFLEGVQVDSVSTAGGEFAENTYRTSVTDGQLNVRIADLGGSNIWAVINALDVVFAGPDVTGPRVIDSEPEATATGPLDRFRLTFNEPIDPASFSLDDVAVLEGPLGTLTPLKVVAGSPGEFEVVFEPQNEPGTYRLVVGPDVTDVAGNPMDQDADGTAGEPVEDLFETMVMLETGPEYVGRFDFGTALSPVAEGFTQVTAATAYSASSGYGWSTGGVYAINRGGDALTRDLNYTADATFATDLADGTYDVTVTMGEALIGHDAMGVFLEGDQVDTVSTAGGQFYTATYRIDVADGQLTLRIADLGGSNLWAVINGLDIVAVP